MNKSSPRKPIGDVPQKKDPYWWMHPAYRGQQALDMETLDAMPSGGYRWTTFDAAPETVDPKLMDHPGAYFTEFAQLLYKANGFKAGPVAQWYVVVCIEPGQRWAVGQLRADPVTPVQIFEDLVFDSEDGAREHAQTLRGEQPLV